MADDRERWKPIYLETKIDSKEQTLSFNQFGGTLPCFYKENKTFRENKFLKKRKPKDYTNLIGRAEKVTDVSLFSNVPKKRRSVYGM